MSVSYFIMTFGMLIYTSDMISVTDNFHLLGIRYPWKPDEAHVAHGIRFFYAFWRPIISVSYFIMACGVHIYTSDMESITDNSHLLFIR